MSQNDQRVVSIVLRRVPDMTWAVELEHQGLTTILASGYQTADRAVEVVAEALTAPLATAETLARYDEGMGQVQGLMDRVTDVEAKLSEIATKVEFMHGLLAAALGGGRTGLPPQSGPIGPGLVQAHHQQAHQPRSQEPGGLRRELVPHQPVGGAMRGPASVGGGGGGEVEAEEYD